MNSFRVARAALRVRPTAFAAPLARRGYADVAADKIQLSLSLPHQVRSLRSATSIRLAQLNARQKKKTENDGLVLTCIVSTGHLQVAGCVRIPTIFPDTAITRKRARLTYGPNSVQVNIPAETGDMGVLASHVPSIEQLRPGLIEVIEESAGSKQFFRTSHFLHLGRQP
jgi:hypothetical protein